MVKEYPLSQTPITWEQACEWIAEGTVDSLGRLQRNPEGQARYEQALDKIHKEYASTADYIAFSIFGVQPQEGTDGRLTAQVPPRPLDAPPDLRWALNEYAYDFESSIQHWLLWSNRKLSIEELLIEIDKKFPGQQTNYWVNPAVLQSVTAIWHAHVLARAPPQA